MAIRYYPTRVFKGKVPAIDREMAKRSPVMVTGAKNIVASGLDYELSANLDWQINSISLKFSSASARNYSAKIKNGRKVVLDLNDWLWLQTADSAPQQITLVPGFYNGTALAAHLKTRMDANAGFSALGITFTVTYNTITGLFVITPSSSTIRYLDSNNAQYLSIRQSIAGHLFGLNASTSFAANVTSDTAIPSLNSEAAIISQTASVLTEHYHDDLHTLSIDQALHLETNTANLNVEYAIVYEELV